MKKTCFLLILVLSTFFAFAENRNIPEPRMGFLENKGQITDFEGASRADVKYVFRGKGVHVFLTTTGLSYQFTKTTYPEGYKELLLTKYNQAFDELEGLRKEVVTETFRIDLELLGANPAPKITADGKSSDFLNYYNHQVLDVHHYSKITYHEVYPGIDWVIYREKDGLKYDFVVRPGADVNLIKMKYNHHEGLSLNPDGSMNIDCRFGSVTESAPISYQAENPVETKFRLKDDVVSFETGSYDASKTLVIDPPFFWATYYGGENDEAGFDIAVDTTGNIYMVGVTASLSAISSVGGHQIIYGGATIDGFIAKFDRQGQREWATYYGGTDVDAINSCAIDADQNLIVVGHTNSTNGISTANSYQHTLAGGKDGFIAKFSPTGIRLWGTYYGGLGNEAIYHCTTDHLGGFLVTGTTGSLNALASANAHQSSYGGGNSDAFLARFNSSGYRVWGTYYGGPKVNTGYTCAIDSLGNCFLIGSTQNDAVMVTPGTHLDSLPFVNASSTYVAKFNPQGNRLWGTFISHGSQGYQGVADAHGNIYVGGIIFSFSQNAFVTPGVHQTTGAGGMDAYVVKLDTAGALIWGTLYGGNSDEETFAITCDNQGNVLLAGRTRSTTGIHHNVFRQPNFGGGGNDGFLAKFSPNGILFWGAYYGHSKEDIITSIKAGLDGRIIVTGHTTSDTGMATPGAFQTSLDAETDAFLAVFQNCFIDNHAYDSLGTFYARHDTVGAQFQWVLCATNTPVPGATNRFFTPQNSGLYKVAIFSGGCYDTSACLSNCVIDNAIKWNPSTLTSNHQNAPSVSYQWLDCDSGFTPIAGATGQSFSPTRSGNFAVAIDDNGCKDTSSCLGFTFMSIDEVEGLGQIQLYPNPSKGEVHILLNDNIALGKNQVKLEVYNMLGQRVLNLPIVSNPQVLDMTKHPNGVYLAKIMHMKSGEIYTQRIVLER